MTAIREIEITNAVNNGEGPEGLQLDAEETLYYYSLISEKEAFERKYHKPLSFELPLECYDDVWD